VKYAHGVRLKLQRRCRVRHSQACPARCRRDRNHDGDHFFGFRGGLNLDLTRPQPMTERAVLPPAAVYAVSAWDRDGNRAAVTIGPAEGTLYYAEYATGRNPWWKRMRRYLRHHGGAA
jgi:hypothetical protein